jgi:YaiO family outer membrane protein
LKNRSYHNTASAGYEWFRRTDGTSLTGIFRASYRHSWAKDAIGASIGYTGRDASWDSESETYTSAGGRGLQFRLQYSHAFSPKLSLSAGAGYATAYFSRWTADVNATLHLPKSWELEAGVQYRLLRDQGHLVGAAVTAAHSLEHFYLGGKVTLGSMHSRFYANGLLRARFFPYAGGRHFVELQGGGGTAPELDYIDSYYTGGVYNKFNTFVALSGNWLATENLAFSGGLTWNTLYGQYSTLRYTNMLIIHVQITVSF